MITLSVEIQILHSLIMEENLLFIETCLKKYEYPNIYGVDIGEILGESNRIFLLSWLYKLIQGGESFEDITEEDLSNFLNTYGFCPTSQTKKFIDMSLDYPVQLQILYRIFRMLTTVKNECEYSEQTEEMSLDMLKSFVQMDVNIFKAFGNLKISDMSRNNGTTLNLLTKQIDEVEKLNNLSKMKEKINLAAKVVSDIMKHKEDNNLYISLDDYLTLKKFNENMVKAKEYIGNIEIVNDLKDRVIFDQIVIPERLQNENIRMAKEITKLIHEI
ncbi:uncharacterized protein LOC123684334 [Harmonia axyridis]|uniref:uncharacterized protein LOC123684334 n=1 Tax=Harmonia axyridis TaxID=115357 RepID=UPI001E279C58|nr:uncharacterized protein LOC123684334 [Harmonia axyridis]